MIPILRPISLSLILCAAGLFGGCRNNPNPDISELENCDSIPLSVKNLVKVVANNDSIGFAALVSYPLTRPYPLHDIETPEQMSAYYSIMVDDSLRQVIISSHPADWKEYGWRGWTLESNHPDNNNDTTIINLQPYLWIDSDLYAVNYVSRREQTMLDSLTARDMASIGKGLAEGWKPEMCLQASDKSAIFRIDVAVNSTDGNTNDNQYRLLVYPKGTDLHDLPAHTMLGNRDTEGSAGTRIYSFKDSHGHIVRFSPDMSDDSEPAIEFPDSILNVSPAYWLDLIK